MTLIKNTKFIPELIKPRISFFVALTAGTGYALAKSHFDISMILTMTGIFLLACGSSVLNHLQEFQTDAKMERTKNRPLAASKISKEFTIATVLFLLVAGCIVLVVFSGAIPTIAGLSGVLWYNFVYTPLKKRLVFAVIPGSIAGAVPSVAGWLAGNGDFLSYQLLIMASFFYIWQLPHFWLLALQYDQDYKKAAFPVITNALSIRQIRLMIFGGCFLTVFNLFLFPVFDLIHSTLSISILLIISFVFLVSCAGLVRIDHKFRPQGYFSRLNVYVLLVTVVVTLEPVCMSISFW